MAKAVIAAPAPEPEIDDVTETLPISFNIDTGKFHHMAVQAQHWITKNVLSMDAAIQVGLVFVCVIFGIVVARILSPAFSRAIESSHLGQFFRIILHRLNRLMTPIAILVLLLMSIIIITSSDIPVQTGFIDAVLRLTAAWIVIRIAVQIVRNRFMRHTIGGCIWLIAALSIFGVLGNTAIMLDSLGVNLGSMRLSALTVVKALFATLIMTYTAFALSSIVERRLEQIPAMSSGSRLLLTKIIRLVLFTMAVLLGITIAGVNLSMLTVFSGAVGLGLGFGLQKGVSNLFTGFMLLFDHTIQPGDIIELQNGTFGIVRQMGSRCTEIITLDKKSFLIPNEYLVSNQVINWSRSGSKIQLNIEFGVGYDQDPDEIIKAAVDAASKVERVMKAPRPSCKMKSFKDGSIEFILFFWIDDAGHGIINAKSEVLRNLWATLKEKNVTIPYTPRTIYQPVPPPSPEAVKD
jgi:small-conductance mechanosensitive channel